MSEPTGPTEVPPPVVQVVSGRPDDRELAALVTVLLSRAGAAQAAGPGGGARAPGLWGAPATLVRGGGGRPAGWGGASATLRG